MHVSAITPTHSIANARKRMQTIAAIDVWAISACKRDCVLHVGSKTFRMYYMCSPRQGKLFYIIIVIFAENALFRSYGIICLPRMPLTTPEPQNMDTNATWG